MKTKATLTVFQILTITVLLVGCAKSDDSGSGSSVVPVTSAPGVVTEPAPVAPILVETPVQISQPSTSLEESSPATPAPSSSITLPISKSTESIPSPTTPLLETVLPITTGSSEPEIETPVVSNPDTEAPVEVISNPEVPVEIVTILIPSLPETAPVSEISNPEPLLETPAPVVTSPEVTTPETATPVVTTPETPAPVVAVPVVEPDNQVIEMKGQCSGKKNVVITFGDQRKESHSEKITVKCVKDSFVLRMTLKKKDLPFIVLNIE